MKTYFQIIITLSASASVEPLSGQCRVKIDIFLLRFVHGGRASAGRRESAFQAIADSSGHPSLNDRQNIRPPRGSFGRLNPLRRSHVIPLINTRFARPRRGEFLDYYLLRLAL